MRAPRELSLVGDHQVTAGVDALNSQKRLLSLNAVEQEGQNS
jgi:hypothetical protein